MDQLSDICFAEIISSSSSIIIIIIITDLKST
jgi:hypothetical protein